MTEYTCTICSSLFDPEKTGGVAGDIGMLPVYFCVWGGSGMRDFCEQFHAPDMCPKCQEKDTDG